MDIPRTQEVGPLWHTLIQQLWVMVEYEMRLQKWASLGALLAWTSHCLCWRSYMGSRDVQSGPAWVLLCYLAQELGTDRRAVCGISGVLKRGGSSLAWGEGHLGVSVAGNSSAVLGWAWVSSANQFFTCGSPCGFETCSLLQSWCVLWRKEYEKRGMRLGKTFNENK